MKRTFRMFFALSAAIMMAAIGATGDPANAYECGNTIGTYLNRYGFDIDFAPVADVNTNPENIVIGPRAFSDNPAVAASRLVPISYSAPRTSSWPSIPLSSV